ncbi:hypothetical protein ACFSR6_20650 [Pedobacter vanadiisoli]|uniref:Uncharacterized protein n=1 Tax=Pedobacter vanadiisoli TaxID=1761975 RepID=A0ABW5MTE8_9SPHI
MPEEYRKVVFDAYQKKKREGNLSSNLLDPTPGNIREECLIIYRERERTPKDDEIFKQFFKGVDRDKGYLTVLENSLAEKFKQMPKILKGGVPNYGLRYAELLAWLIDFQPRPSTSYYTSFYKDKPSDLEEVIGTTNVKIGKPFTTITSGNDDGKQNPENEKINKDREENKQGEIIKDEKERIGKPTTPPIVIIPVKTDDVKINGGNIEQPPIIPPKPEYVPRFSPRYITISCIILLFVGTTSFAVWERLPTSIRMPHADEKFMYWDEDHYEPVKDDKQNVGAPIIPLNVQTLTEQRKINLPDTLTSYSIGKVWYKGFMKDHEFFTSAGAYPMDTTRVLKKLTPTILAKYISNNRYLKNRLIGLLYAIIFITLFGYGVSRLKKEVKQPMKKSMAEEGETLDIITSQAVSC